MLNWILILAVVLISGQLWRMGGDGQKWARAFVMPTLIALLKVYLLGWNWWAILYAPVLWGLMSLFSYGLSAPPHKFWVWVFGGKGSTGDYLPVECLTRATCGLFWAQAAIVFAILSGGWGYYIIYTVFLTAANAFWGTVKEVEISERGVGASVAGSLLV